MYNVERNIEISQTVNVWAVEKLTRRAKNDLV